MSDFVKRHPALSLFLAALVFGPVLVAPVLAGWLPREFLQLGALSASLGGFLVAAIEGGRAACRELLGRVRIWRVGVRWWLAALLLPLLPALGAVLLAAPYAHTRIQWSSFGAPYRIVPTMLVLIVFAGLGEEFGWRGFALPRLRARHSLGRSAVIIGAFHALWHIPLFLVPGESYHALAAQLGFVPAFLGYATLVVALSFQLAWIFANTAGSVLLAAVYHGAGNAWAGYFAIDQNGLAGPVAFVGAHALLAALLMTVVGVRPITDRLSDSMRTGHGEPPPSLRRPPATPPPG